MGTSDRASGLVQGTLDLLMLRTLGLEPMHGYGIRVRLEQISRGVFQVNAGSLFPAFRRLERDGLMTAAWRDTKISRRTKYYALARRGQAALERQTRDWETQVAAIGRILHVNLGEL